MEENYIHIFSVYMSELMKEGKISPADLMDLIKDFLPICEEVHSRQQMVDFLDQHMVKFSFLLPLKEQLLDSHHIFLD